MSEEEKKTDDEEKTIPNTEGYTIVKYLEFVVFLCYGFFGTIVPIPFMVLLKNHNYSIVLPIILMCGSFVLFWLIGHKITEVTVNLKISDKGLEQTRLSGSKFYPEYRLIEWKDMKRYYPIGRSSGIDFLICVDSDTNFRISMPGIRVFERQKNNTEKLTAFREDFSMIASEQGVPCGLFGKRKKTDVEK